MSLPDRPGALACLAQECGKAGVDILRLHVHPDGDRVVDELVLEVPDAWREEDLRELVERSGGTTVVAAPCTSAALEDQPTRYVEAARAVLDRPASFPEVVAQLFDADAGAVAGTWEEGHAMELTVGDTVVQVRRAVPFTAVEERRGRAMAALVERALGRARPSDPRRLGRGAAPVLAVEGARVTATVEGIVVGHAEVRPRAAVDGEPRVCDLGLEVDAAWRRRGLGTRLLGEAVRVASGLGADEVVLTTHADNQAVLPVVLATGLRSRIRMAGDRLTVRIGLAEVRPRPPGWAVAGRSGPASRH